MADALARCTAAGIEVRDAPIRMPRLRRSRTRSHRRARSRMRINAWEWRWPLNTYRERDASKLSRAMLDRLAEAETMSLDDYRARPRAARASVARSTRSSRPTARPASASSAPAAAPIGLESTGNPNCTVHASLLGIPAVSLPVLQDARASARPAGRPASSTATRDASRSARSIKDFVLGSARCMNPIRARASTALARYRDGPPTHPRSYPDLHEHVLALAREGLLVVVDEPINKDTEMHPLVRWQYRGGIPEPRAQGVPVHAADRFEGPPLRYRGAGRGARGQPRRLSHRLRPPLDEIGGAWVKAIAQPIAPRIVERRALPGNRDRPASDLDRARRRARRPAGADLDAGLGQCALSFRRPLHHQGPGHRHPERRQLSRTDQGAAAARHEPVGRAARRHLSRIGTNTRRAASRCPARSWSAARRSISYASVQKMPENLDEIAVAGALAGGPINVVRAKTVDLLVPAEAEIVIEGLIDTECARAGSAVRRVARLRQSAGIQRLHGGHRDHAAAASDPHLVHQPGDAERIERHPPRRHGAGLSQSSASRARRSSGVKRVSMHEPLTSLYAVIAIQFERGTPETEVWRALHGASTLHRFAGKWIIAVDEDIDPDNADALFWAMSYRCQPQHDLQVRAAQGSRPRAARTARRRREAPPVLINATLKGTYAPVALPKREFMETRQGDLGAARPAAAYAASRRGTATISATGRTSWRGRPRWRRSSEYFELGKELANERRSDVAMNTPVNRAEENTP